MWQVLVLTGEDTLSSFERWYLGLRDTAARTRIAARITRVLQAGNFGNHRERISGAISEMKVDYGPGYRIYYVRLGNLIIVLIGGGTKDSQQSDIETAVALWERYKDNVEKYSQDISI